MTPHKQKIEALRCAGALLLALSVYFKQPITKWKMGSKYCKIVSDLCSVSLPNNCRISRALVDDIYENGIQAEALKEIFNYKMI